MDRAELRSSLISLLEEYVRRQSLVLKALRDLRPDIVMRSRNEGTPEERAQLTKVHYQTPQSGYWGDKNEWQYFVHGIGCRLIHTSTQEPVEWDAGDVRRFDRDWFLYYLEWAIKYKPQDPNVSTLIEATEESDQSLKALVFSELERLHQEGILSKPDQQFRYTLLTIDEPTDR